MDIIQGYKTTEIAGAKIGETIIITLITRQIDKVVLSNINKLGIEGFNLNLKDKPLTFYSFHNILKVTKSNNLEQG